jgi:hypothetical protein
MIEQQLINDYAKRETLLGTELVEIIFGASVCTLEESLKAHLFYPNLSSEIQPKVIKAYASLVKGMVIRFSTNPNENASKEQLLNIKIDVQIFCSWLLEKVRAMPDFALSHSAGLFVDTALGTNAQSKKLEKDTAVNQEFPPRLKGWRMVKFLLSADRGFQIQAAGKFFSVEEVALPSGQKEFLYQVLYTGGVFDKDKFPEIQNISQKVERLNQTLQTTFKLNEKPISFNQTAKAYEAHFLIEIDYGN